VGSWLLLHTSLFWVASQVKPVLAFVLLKKKKKEVAKAKVRKRDPSAGEVVFKLLDAAVTGM
jgi:hypothetical protein